MITVYEEDVMLSKFESMSEIEIQSFLEKLKEALKKRSLSHLMNDPLMPDLEEENEELKDKIRQARFILS